LLRLGWLLLDGGVILGSNYVIFQQLGANAPKGMLFFSLAGDNVGVRFSCRDGVWFLA
jgi:hypothetical protein